jgi:hypothetical protein
MINPEPATQPYSLQLIAALSAVISAAVSGVAIVLNNILERRSRTKEAALERLAREQEATLEREAKRYEALRERSANRKQWLMQEAAKLAEWRVETIKRSSELSNRPVTLTDPIIGIETYYNWLTHLWKHGRLPDDPKLER